MCLSKVSEFPTAFCFRCRTCCIHCLSEEKPHASTSTTWFTAYEHAVPEIEQEAVAKREALARRVAHLQPIAAQAQLMSENVDPDDMPSFDQIQKARRMRLGHQEEVVPVTGRDWLEMIAEVSSNGDRKPYEFRWYKFKKQAMWMPLPALETGPGDPAEGCVLLMSDNQKEIARQLVRVGQNDTQKQTLVIDVTWKISLEGQAGQKFMTSLQKYRSIGASKTSRGTIETGISFEDL